MTNEHDLFEYKSIVLKLWSVLIPLIIDYIYLGVRTISPDKIAPRLGLGFGLGFELELGLGQFSSEANCPRTIYLMEWLWIPRNVVEYALYFLVYLVCRNRSKKRGITNKE